MISDDTDELKLQLYHVSFPAPSVAPRDLHVTKNNETMFIVAWQPLTRQEANAIQIDYKITWTLTHIGRAKRETGKETFTATTQESQYVLTNLRLCAEYAVYVAGATQGGLGPNVTTIITTSSEYMVNLSKLTFIHSLIYETCKV